jgi:hypothetical protein
VLAPGSVQWDLDISSNTSRLDGQSACIVTKVFVIDPRAFFPKVRVLWLSKRAVFCRQTGRCLGTRQDAIHDSEKGAISWGKTTAETVKGTAMTTGSTVTTVKGTTATFKEIDQRSLCHFFPSPVCLAIPQQPHHRD